MWFLGAIAGLVLGAMTERPEFAVLGAVAGALVGMLLKARVGDASAAGGAETVRRLEAKVDWLYQEQQRLLQRVAALEDGRLHDAPVPPEDQQAAGIMLDTLEAAAPTAKEATPASIAAMAPTDSAGEPAIAARRAADEIEAGQPAGARQGALARWLFGGNTVVRVGVVVLFFGVAFLLRYTYERVAVPIEIRLMGVVLAAIALLAVGWRLRQRRSGYALALQGGGVGLLYLTVFAALRLYALLPAGAALVLLAALAVFSAMIAVLQNSAALAILGASGGFLAPVLASTGGGSHVMLFSYYVLLDAGILAIAWFRAWRGLNLLGFAFTFLIGGLWGFQYYRPALYASTQPFLALFFLMYVGIPLLFARREVRRLRSYVDATLVFGTPLVAFGYQLALVDDLQYGATFSALALGAFYLVLAWWLHRRAGAPYRLLVESFLALGVGFATLAIPLAFEGRWTAAAWALEGAAIFWVGVRQQRLLARSAAVLLQFAAGFAFLVDVPAADGQLPVLNSACLGAVLIAVAGLFSTWYLERNESQVHKAERLLVVPLFIWGALWWAAAGMLQIDRHVAAPYQDNATLMYVTASSVLLSLVARAGAWRVAARACVAFTPLALLAAAATAAGAVAHPSARLGFVAWPAVVVCHFWLLRRHDDELPRLAPWLHGAGVWLLALICSAELAWWIGRLVDGAGVWPAIAWMLVPGAMLMGLAGRGRMLGGTVMRHEHGYLVFGVAPMAAFLLLWALFVTASRDGDPAPLPYVPLLNPLDLAVVAAVLLPLFWLMAVRRRELLAVPESVAHALYGILAVVGFVVANGMLLRALHHLASVPFAVDAMLRSVTVQSAISVFWTVLALVTMVVATQRALRAVWLTGAALMAVVVAKLFLVDLSHVGGIERIVSFIGVGVLMLVIGYFSPVPPKGERR